MFYLITLKSSLRQLKSGKAKTQAVKFLAEKKKKKDIQCVF